MSVSSSINFLALVSAISLFIYIMMGDTTGVPKPTTNVPSDKIKYILDWKREMPDHYYYKDRSRVAAKNISCRLYPNCFVTNDRDLLSDMRDFDAVLIHGMMLPSLLLLHLPQERSQKQKYIFATRESAPNFPVCDPHYDGYFNWTSTYRLDSDLRWGYITIYDLRGNLIGPKTNMSWTPLQNPTNRELRNKLRSKSKTAAWFASHCPTNSKREHFVEEVSGELRQYNMTVDIYGKCSKDKDYKSKLCPKNHWYCNKMIEKDYYFYFSFENSFDEDYVTEKLLSALNNYAVPVVYGGADYSRFLPPGSYLDGRTLGAEVLARTMRDIIHNRSRYEDMFRWRNYYHYKDSHFMTDVCNMCAKLNEPEELARVTVYTDFRGWWNRDQKLCEGWSRPE